MQFGCSLALIFPCVCVTDACVQSAQRLLEVHMHAHSKLLLGPFLFLKLEMNGAPRQLADVMQC